jgi:hypothetical protein
MLAGKETIPMMPVINFRIPPELLAAAERRAAAGGLSISDYVRGLIERDCGLVVPVKLGLAGADPGTRKRVSRAGVKATRLRVKEQTHARK